MILSRLPGSRFSTVGREWQGRTAVLLGGGSSLSPDQFALVRAARDSDTVRVIAINDAYLAAPWADVLYAADPHWWTWHSTGVAKPMLDLTAEEVRHQFETFPGERCSIWNTSHPIPAESDVHFLRNFHENVNANGLSADPEKLVTGWHGGFQALNLAILAGAKKVILSGYDGKPGDKSHWHGSHRVPTPQIAYDLYRQSFIAAQNEIRAAAQVINCSPGSAIDTFEKMDLADALRL